MSAQSPDPRFLPLIFDSIAHGIFTIDSNGRITSFNRMAEELTGYGREEVIGRRCDTVFMSDHCETKCPLKRSIHSGGRGDDNEVTIVTKSGVRLPIAISTAALTDEAHRIVGGVEMFRDLRQVTELRKRLEKSYVFEDIVSKNHQMQRIFEILPLVAASESTVLIQGESGTGKELVARAIHNLGPRRVGPFVALNCGAVPDGLMEAELFGYKQGAFTDAKGDRAGRFGAARGGTLLLDEIGELPLQVQSKLLRVLQQKEYEPLGSSQTVKADVRVIASTNRDLAREVKERRFRSDLYYRVNVVQIDLPPLRERKEDLPLLVQHFIDRFNALQGRRITNCSDHVLAALMRYPFPGNIREFENAIEHAFVVCIATTIQMDDLPPHILAYEQRAPECAPARAELPLQQAQADAVRASLEANNYNRTATAAALGVSRNTLWRKMKKLGIEGPK
jgi:PAS domain S-box-containing protein